MPLTREDLREIDSDCDVNLSQYVSEKLANHLAFKEDWSDADHFYVKYLLRMPHGIDWFDILLRDRPGDFPYRQSRVEILVELTANHKNTPRNYTIHVLGLIGVGISVAFWWMS